MSGNVQVHFNYEKFLNLTNFFEVLNKITFDLGLCLRIHVLILIKIQLHSKFREAPLELWMHYRFLNHFRTSSGELKWMIVIKSAGLMFTVHFTWRLWKRKSGGRSHNIRRMHLKPFRHVPLNKFRRQHCCKHNLVFSRRTGFDIFPPRAIN